MVLSFIRKSTQPTERDWTDSTDPTQLSTQLKTTHIPPLLLCRDLHIITNTDSNSNSNSNTNCKLQTANCKLLYKLQTPNSNTNIKTTTPTSPSIPVIAIAITITITITVTITVTIITPSNWYLQLLTYLPTYLRTSLPPHLLTSLPTNLPTIFLLNTVLNTSILDCFGQSANLFISILEWSIKSDFGAFTNSTYCIKPWKIILYWFTRTPPIPNPPQLTLQIHEPILVSVFTVLVKYIQADLSNFGVEAFGWKLAIFPRIDNHQLRFTSPLPHSLHIESSILFITASTF
ncbi:hypothetical protein EYC84_007537 [Monilinia fructicola]|uniref:Uncharacterized protein n=1 Tax=Monilinia fructicola TaxID=38448 RepID=A0A5M9JL24_MONFR|nr:hypothetical protein EYC84_007537 [Monilinia fructicola]